MNELSNFPDAPLDLAVRIGCKLRYEAAFTASMLLNVKARQDPYQLVAQEALDIAPFTAPSEFRDDHGNTILRLDFEPGTTTLTYDAIARVPSLSEDFARVDAPVPPGRLPAGLLRYTLSSRYCDSDKLKDFAWQHFGEYQQGLERIQAICNWLHENIEYRTGSGSSVITAHEVIQRGRSI